MCTSFQRRGGEADRMILKPVSKDLVGDLDGHLDLRQLDGLVLPPGSHGEGGHGHGHNQRHRQHKNNDLFHIILTFANQHTKSFAI